MWYPTLLEEEVLSMCDLKNIRERKKRFYPPLNQVDSFAKLFEFLLNTRQELVLKPVAVLEATSIIHTCGLIIQNAPGKQVTIPNQDSQVFAKNWFDLYSKYYNNVRNNSSRNNLSDS